MTRERKRANVNEARLKFNVKRIFKSKNEIKVMKDKIWKYLKNINNNKDRHIKKTDETLCKMEENFSKYQNDLKNHMKINDQYKESLVTFQAIDKFSLNGPPLDELIQREKENMSTTFACSTPKLNRGGDYKMSDLNIPETPIPTVRSNNNNNDNNTTVTTLKHNISTLEMLVDCPYTDSHQFCTLNDKTVKSPCTFHLKSNDKITRDYANMVRCNRCRICIHDCCASSAKYGKMRCIAVILNRKVVDDIVINRKVNLESLFNKPRARLGKKPMIPELLMFLIHYIELKIKVNGPMFFRDVLTKVDHDEALRLLKIMKNEGTPACLPGINMAMHLFVAILQTLSKPLLSPELFAQLRNAIYCPSNEFNGKHEAVWSVFNDNLSEMCRDSLVYCLIHFAIMHKVLYHPKRGVILGGSSEKDFLSCATTSLTQVVFEKNPDLFRKSLDLIKDLLSSDIIIHLINKLVRDCLFFKHLDEL